MYQPELSARGTETACAGDRQEDLERGQFRHVSAEGRHDDSCSGKHTSQPREILIKHKKNLCAQKNKPATLASSNDAPFLISPPQLRRRW